ncbi:MAG: hypothetical protein Q9198_008860, partial [Flavoplaca austrocitrina]
MAERILKNEFKALSQEQWVNVEVSQHGVEKSAAPNMSLQLQDDDILNWKIALIIINPDSLYYG